MQRQEGSLFPAPDSGVQSWIGATLQKDTDAGRPDITTPGEAVAAAGQIQALSVHEQTSQVALVHYASSRDEQRQTICVMPVPEIQTLQHMDTC